MATNRIETIFTAQDRATAVMRQIAGSADNLQGSFEKIQAPLLRAQTLWTSLVSGAVVGSILSLVRAIDDLDEAAQGLGTTAVQLSGLRQAGVEAGVGVEKLDTALTRLNVTISEANAGDVKAGTLFRAFGSGALEAAVKSGDTVEVLKRLADEFEKLQDGPAKAALAVDLFGRGAQVLVPLLNQGGDGLERFTGLTEKTVREAARLQAEIDKLSQSWQNFKFSIAGGLVPELNLMIGNLKRIGDEIGAVNWSSGREAAEFFINAMKNKNDWVAAQKAANKEVELGAKALGDEGKEAQKSAQAVRDKAAADLAAAQAARAKARATDLARTSYAREFAEAQRRRDNRERLREDEERDRQDALRRQQQLVDQMTGRTSDEDIQQRIDLLNKMKSGEIAASREEIAIAEASIFGVTQGVNTELERQIELSDQLGLTISSSLGELITSGGKAGDVFKALGQDILKLITQLLILKPLAEELSKIFKGGGSAGGGASGGMNFFSQMLAAIGGMFAGGGSYNFTGGNTGELQGTGAGPGDAGGGVMAAPMNIYIDGATDRARISYLVEQGVKAGLARSWDSTQRGGTGVLA